MTINQTNAMLTRYGDARQNHSEFTFINYPLICSLMEYYRQHGRPTQADFERQNKKVLIAKTVTP